MKLYYPAIFLKEDDGRYSVSFPDVPEAITCGYDFENAVEMAKECLELEEWKIMKRFQELILKISI